MNILEHVEIAVDHDYTATLQTRLREQYASGIERTATHLSGLLMCLLKEWGKLHLPRSEWRKEGASEEDDPILTWSQGLQFEALVAEGVKQIPFAYCFECRAVSSPGIVTNRDGNRSEAERCPVCNQRWLLATPDWLVEGRIHEAKQTRKSARKGPQDAPWWIEQLVSYLIFYSKREGDQSPRT